MRPDDVKDCKDSDTAVVVLGHGSRASGSHRTLEWVAGRLGARLDCHVRAAFLQFNQPDLAGCCRELADGGVTRIFIAPYFLFDGNHMIRDIPEELGKLEAELDGVDFYLASTLGTDEQMVRLLMKRIGEAGYGPEPPARTDGPELTVHPIESESFRIIDRLVGPADPGDPRYVVSRRVVHATGDITLADALSFTGDAIGAGIRALAGGAPVFCDVNMVAAGVGPTARNLGLEVHCGIAEPETALVAASEGITRGAAAFRRRHREDSGALDGAVAVIGNAPTALFELLRLARDEGIRPALVIGVPVGFVGAAESKEELAGSGLDAITLPGNRGGSNVAVAIANALMKMAGAADG